MKTMISWGCLKNYSILCASRLSQVPKGNVTPDDPRIESLVDIANRFEVGSEDYVKGIVEQLKIEGRPPIHYLGVCGEQGSKLFEKYQQNKKTYDAAECMTRRVDEERDFESLIISELTSFSKIIRTNYRMITRKNFEDSWEEEFNENKKLTQRIKILDSSSLVPSSFKIKALHVWVMSGRTLPIVSAKYSQALNEPEVNSTFSSFFPFKTKK
jgi:hypothetical protein